MVSLSYMNVALKADETLDRVVCFSSLIVLIVDVVSTELTLHWNHVGGIYEVASTGQIIPLVVGIGSMIAVIWKLKTLRKVTLPPV